MAVQDQALDCSIGGSVEEVLTVFALSLFGICALAGLLGGYREGPSFAIGLFIAPAAGWELPWPDLSLAITLTGQAAFVRLFWYGRKRAGAMSAPA